MFEPFEDELILDMAKVIRKPDIEKKDNIDDYRV